MSTSSDQSSPMNGGSAHSPNPDFRSELAALLNSMPVFRFYGIEVENVSEGLCDLILPCRGELTHDGRTFQASISGAIADFAGGGAAVTLLPRGWAVATTGYELHLLRPAVGSYLRARGLVLRSGRLDSVARAEVFATGDGEERLCATAIVLARHVQLKPGG